MVGQEQLGAAAVRSVVELPVSPVIAAPGLVRRLPEVAWPPGLALTGLLRVEAGPGQVPVEQGGRSFVGFAPATRRQDGKQRDEGWLRPMGAG